MQSVLSMPPGAWLAQQGRPERQVVQVSRLIRGSAHGPEVTAPTDKPQALAGHFLSLLLVSTRTICFRVLCSAP